MFRRLLILVLLITWARPASAAITFVQAATSAGNDATMTWSAAPSASNVVVVIVHVNDETQTVSITGWTPTVTTLAGPTDSPGLVMRGYTFCTVGDGADTEMVFTTSGGGNAHSIAVELAGAEDCLSILDDVETSDNTGTDHDLATDLTTSQAGDFIFAHVRVTAGTGDLSTPDAAFTSIPAGDAELNSTSLGQYKIAGASGSEETPFDSAASETTFMMSVALKEATVAGGNPNATLLLLRSGTE